ncbi:MAG: thioredoxin family protein [Anaerolineales bacterium]|nr:MAG: thioredoxin family protein [Anaerolineales bacterium]
MMVIKVLGPGCKNCERLEMHADQAVEQLQAENPKLEVTVEKVTDVNAFLDYGLLKTPGLVINEKLVSSGRIPSPSQISGWIEEALTQEE